MRAGSRRGASEDVAERAARAVLEAELGCTLVRVTPTDRPTVDYRTPAGDMGIEVKRLTSETFHAAGDAYGRVETLVEDRRLTGRWAVMVPRADLSTLLPRPGDVPVFGGGPPVRLKNLAAELVEPFVVLERHGISWNEMPLPPAYMAPNLATALTTINRRAPGADYYRSDAPPGSAGQVQVLLAHSWTRTGLADTAAQRVAQWLASMDSANLLDSLANEPAGTERVAFIVLDANTEPEVRTAQEQPAAFCPTVPLALPSEIDVIWILLGPVACRFDPTADWTSRVVASRSALP